MGLAPGTAPPDRPLDAVVVGGGVIGLCAAWESACRGLTVAVVDPAPGRGASWVAAGMLAPVTEAHFGEEALVALLLEAARAWPGFVSRLEAAAGAAADGGEPAGVGYRRGGTLTVGLDASDRAAIDRLLEYQRSLGLAATRRSGAECRAAVPALAPGVQGGAEMPGDHQVDNRRLVAALLAACGAAGVALLEGPVHHLSLDGAGRVTGVVLGEAGDGATLPAGAVVLAAGCESAHVGGLPPPAVPPVRPVKGHVVRLRGPAARPLLPRTVRALVHGRGVYLVPRADGSVVVGATMEERGFDRTVQAGAVHELLHDARTAVPGIDELEWVECRTGLRPATPDNAPIVGWSAVDGLLVATGHHRNGILLTPITATAVAALLSGEAPPAALAPFGPERFAPAGARP